MDNRFGTLPQQRNLSYSMYKTVYNISLKGYVGGYNFDCSIVDRELVKRVICGVHSGRKRRAFTEE